MLAGTDTHHGGERRCFQPQSRWQKTAANLVTGHSYAYKSAFGVIDVACPPFATGGKFLWLPRPPTSCAVRVIRRPMEPAAIPWSITFGSSRSARAIRWTYRVHEQILPALRRANIAVRWTDITVRHTGYVDQALRARKLDRDTRILQAELEERPDDPFVLFNLGAIAVERKEWTARWDFFGRSLAGSAPSGFDRA